MQLCVTVDWSNALNMNGNFCATYAQENYDSIKSSFDEKFSDDNWKLPENYDSYIANGKRMIDSEGSAVGKQIDENYLFGEYFLKTVRDENHIFNFSQFTDNETCSQATFYDYIPNCMLSYPLTQTDFRPNYGIIAAKPLSDTLERNENDELIVRDDAKNSFEDFFIQKAIEYNVIDDSQNNQVIITYEFHI